VNPALLLSLVLLAALGFVNLFLSVLVALLWRTGLSRMTITSADLFSLRLLPVTGGLLVAVTVVLPAFLAHEPRQQHEAAGPLLVTLSAFALGCVMHAIWRGWRACVTTRTLLKAFATAERRIVEGGQEVQLVDIPEPHTAVIGVWRPRILASTLVRSICSEDEFRQVVAHETAHIHAHDNLKLFLMLASPDMLAWTALGATLTDRWRTEAERDADGRATGDDLRKRVALASALIKVARLFNAYEQSRPAATSMAVANDDVSCRVRLLLTPPVRRRPSRILHTLAACALLTPFVALPLHALVHELVESVVKFNI
jgi:Zn-dependent protease with chaperone function